MLSQRRSGEPERAALLRPSQRQAGMGEELLSGEVARMAAFEDRPRDVGREKGQPQDPREIGSRQPFTLRDIGEIFAAALGQLVAEEVRPGNRLDQLAIRSCRPPWRSRLVDQHSDAETGTPELCLDRQDNGLLLVIRAIWRDWPGNSSRNKAASRLGST